MATIYIYKQEPNRAAIAVAAAEYLAYKQNRRVLLVDWDFDATPFISFFPEAQIVGKTMIDLLHYYKSKGWRKWQADKIDLPIHRKNLEACIISCVALPTKGCIDLVPRQRENEDDAKKIKGLKWLSFYNKFEGERFVFRTKAVLKEMAYDDVFIYKMPGFYGDYGLFEGNFSGMIADFWTDFMKSDRDFATKIAMENTYLEAITYIHEEVSEQLSDAYYLLGNLYEAQQSYHQAIVNYQDAYRIRQQIFGSRHAYTLQICLELAVLHEKNGDMDKANAYKAFVVAK